MILALGSDHAGRVMKEYLGQVLSSLGHEILDLGTHSEASCDYPDQAVLVGEAVVQGRARFGVLVCGTGIGMSIAANKVVGVRAALVHDPVTASLAMRHNNANVLCLGARLMALEYARTLVETWLAGEYEPRHDRRLEKISRLECCEAEAEK